MNKVVDENETESYTKVATSKAEEANEQSESAQTIIVSRNKMIFNNQDC